MARVTGIGGVFLRAKDPAALRQWYANHLGILLEDYGSATFKWTDQVPAGTGMTTWAVFKQDSDYFGNHAQQVMINYRVDDLDALVSALQHAGVNVDPKRENAPYGKFAWVTDPEGNRLELWQPMVKEKSTS